MSMNLRLVKNQAYLFCCVCLVLLLPSTASADPLAPYVEAAKKEGSAVLGITIRNTTMGKPSGAKYIAAFQKRYPFLKVELKRIGGASERERVLSEMTAGLVKYDVGIISDTMMDTLTESKVPLIVEWKKLGVLPDLVHPKNIGISLRTSVYGIGYNRNLVPDKVAQSFTWETCADPKWKGKTATDDRPRHLDILFHTNGWGREKTLDYAKRWAANKPAVEASRSTGAQKLAAGAYHLICGMPRKQVMDLRVYGGVESVGIAYPEPVPVSSADLTFVPQKAKSPNAGVLFMAWSATQEAQTLLDDADFTAHPQFEGSDVNRVLKGKKLVYGDWEQAKRSEEYLVEILQAMGFPVVR